MTSRTITLGDFEVIVETLTATWNETLGKFVRETSPLNLKGFWSVGGGTCRSFRSVAGAIRSLRQQVTADRAGWRGDEKFVIAAVEFVGGTITGSRVDADILCK